MSAVWGVLRTLWPAIAGVLPYVNEAESVCRWLAERAGNRDWNALERILNEIASFLNAKGGEELAKLNSARVEVAMLYKNSGNFSDALLFIALFVLRWKFPSIAERHARRVVELAYGLLKP